MSYTNHLFISYAHIDNYYDSTSSRGWIDLLHERLEIRLAQLLGRKPTIWRDRKIQGNDVFNQTIHIELGKAVILLSVVTPRYIASPSCQDELNIFIQLALQTGGLRLDDKHRIFKVVKTQVPLEKQPPELRQLLGYEFYQLDQASGRFREFDHESSARGEKDKRYWDKFEDLAQDIKLLLERIEQPDAPSPPTNGKTIYLAETTSDLADHRDKVHRELRQFGHVILPDQPLPTSKPKLEQLVRGCLQLSRLSVHLIGEHYGFVPDQEPERSVIWLQQDLARERGDNAEFSRLIWLPPGLEPKDERQRRFIETLQNSFHSTNGSDLVQTKIEDLKTIIQNKLNPPSTPAPIKGADDGLKRVYLVCDPRDLGSIEPLYNYLYEEGCEVMLPAADETALQSHKQNMLDCDAALFYYASAAEIWLRTHLRQMTGFGRLRPLAAVGVFVTGEETPQKKLFMTREALVIKNFGEFDPASLDDFLKQLNQAKGGAK
jgi:hypothetical protein